MAQDRGSNFTYPLLPSLPYGAPRHMLNDILDTGKDLGLGAVCNIRRMCIVSATDFCNPWENLP